MPKNREKQKLNKKIGKIEEMLESKNSWNCTDKTPMNVIRVQKGLEIIY